MADATTLATTNGRQAQTAASETDKDILEELARKQRVADLKARGWKVEMSAGTATLLDPDEITERRAKAIKVAMMRSAPDGEHMDADAAIDSGYVMVAAFLREWTVELPMPPIGNPDSLLDLKAKDFRILSDAVADLRAELFVDYGTDTPAALADPSSPLGAGGG